MLKEAQGKKQYACPAPTGVTVEDLQENTVNEAIFLIKICFENSILDKKDIALMNLEI